MTVSKWQGPRGENAVDHLRTTTRITSANPAEAELLAQLGAAPDQHITIETEIIPPDPLDAATATRPGASPAGQRPTPAHLLHD